MWSVSLSVWVMWPALLWISRLRDSYIAAHKLYQCILCTVRISDRRAIGGNCWPIFCRESAELGSSLPIISLELLSIFGKIHAQNPKHYSVIFDFKVNYMTASMITDTNSHTHKPITLWCMHPGLITILYPEFIVEYCLQAHSTSKENKIKPVLSKQCFLLQVWKCIWWMWRINWTVQWNLDWLRPLLDADPNICNWSACFLTRFMMSSL